MLFQKKKVVKTKETPVSAPFTASKFVSGEYINCTINGVKVKDARIVVDKSNNNLTIKHNSNDYRTHGGGERIDGYNYSYHVDYHVSEITKLNKPFERIKNKVKRAVSPYLGCDPEFFFMKDGKVRGSEEVLSPNGNKSQHGSIIIDGVQAELNPTHDRCRERLSYRIGMLLSQVRKLSTDVSFEPCVPIEIGYLNSLSDKAKHFGCTPSFNVYEKMDINMDASTYPHRPAGGHIHLGHCETENIKKALTNTKVIVPLLDIIVANTCVLIDRHSGNVERRKLYGRAGEFRTPKHGLEYRTLSNFWLQSYPLMSFVFGLSRMCVDIIVSDNNSDKFVQRILGAVDQKDIIKAINNNDFDLALLNFSKVSDVLADIMQKGSHSLDSSNIQAFLYFVGKVKEHGLTYWFKKNPLDYWADYAEGGIRGHGWENFLEQVVKEEMKKKDSMSGKILTKLNLD